jgi:hypothetical protein
VPCPVIVVDTTPPALSCPEDMVIDFLNETGAVATFGATATDACFTASVTLAPASGSTFPIGVTPVRVQAIDGSGNRAQCTFNVTVLGAWGVKSSVLDELIALRNSTQHLEGKELSKAIDQMSRAVAADLWVDQTHVVRDHGDLVFQAEEAAVRDLEELLGPRRRDLPPNTVQELMARLVKCDRLLAVVRILEAASAGANPKEVAADLEEVARGDSDAAQGRPAQAVEHYRNAWNGAGFRPRPGTNHAHPSGTARP